MASSTAASRRFPSPWESGPRNWSVAGSGARWQPQLDYDYVHCIGPCIVDQLRFQSTSPSWTSRERASVRRRLGCRSCIHMCNICSCPQVECKDANYAFLCNYLGLFSAIPTAKETQAGLMRMLRSLHCLEIVHAMSDSLGQLGSGVQDCIEECNQQRDPGIVPSRRQCVMRLRDCFCMQDWANVEGSLHRALGSYVHRRCCQNLTARLGRASQTLIDQHAYISLCKEGA